MPEAWGVWAVDGPVQLVLPLTATPDGDLEFSADIHPFDDGRGYFVRSAAVQIDGQYVTDLTLSGPGEQHIRFAIPVALMASKPVLTITFLFKPAKSPAELRLSIDRRHLAWGFQAGSPSRLRRPSGDQKLNDALMLPNTSLPCWPTNSSVRTTSVAVSRTP